MRCDHPVADLMLLAIAAKAEKLIGLDRSRCPPNFTLGCFESGKLTRGRQKSKHVTAIDTFHVFKENETSTAITMKCFHACRNERQSALYK
jgi:hypothetical protein